MENLGNDKLVLYAIPLFLFMVGLEAWISTRRQRGWYQREDAFASLSMGVGNVVISGALKAFWLGLFVWLYQYRVFDLDLHSAWVWIGGLFLQDFCFYWYHRSSHRIRLLWAAHENHHSSRFFNFTTALRQSWTTPLYSASFFLPMALLGFHPLMILTYQAISLIYQFFLHTESVDRLGLIEWVMNTPSHHRVHHGRNPEYIDCNYAGIFIIWDRLFGSFVPEKARVDFGLVGEHPSYNPLHIAVHHFVLIARDLRQARSSGDVLGILFRGPEWWKARQLAGPLAAAAANPPVGPV